MLLEVSFVPVPADEDALVAGDEDEGAARSDPDGTDDDETKLKKAASAAASALAKHRHSRKQTGSRLNSRCFRWTPGGHD